MKMLRNLSPKHGVKLHLIEAGFTRHPGRSVSSHLSFAPIRFPAHVALIEHPVEGLHLFDTGYSERFKELTQRLPEAIYRWITPVSIDLKSTAAAKMKAVGFQPSDVRSVILSHFHADHIGGAFDFKQARFVCDLPALKALNQFGPWEQLRHGYIRSFLPPTLESQATDFRSLKQVPPPFDGLGEGFDLFGDQTVILIPLPGHAYGHLGLLVHTQEGRWKFLISDAAWTHENYREKHTPSRIAQILFLDRVEYIKTINALHQIFKSQDNLDIIPCHCERPHEVAH